MRSIDGRWLALIPVGVGLILAPLVLPIAVTPRDVPLPTLDLSLLSRGAAADDALAAHVDRLPAEAVALGVTVRLLNAAEGRGVDDEASALRGAIARDFSEAWRVGGADAIRQLRAVQLKEFLFAVARFDATGEQDEQHFASTGSFISRMQSAGWADKSRVFLTENERRAAFKMAWNRLVIPPDRAPEFELTTEERKALYGLYLARPHVAEAARSRIDEALESARDDESCRRAAAAERAAIEGWRLDKIDRLAQIDPAYPADYARGISHYRGGDWARSAHSFRSWLAAHPDGAYSIRARNFLKSAIMEAGSAR